MASINRQEKVVITGQGEALDYDRLILATGSYPFVPPIEGTDNKGVFTYRTVEDVQAIEAYAKKSVSAAVLGGGLLGLESADVLRRSGLQTHVIESANGLMPRRLNQEGSEALESLVGALGVALHLSKKVLSIQQVDELLRIDFSEGQGLVVDMVVVAAGIRPRSELAEEAGLACSGYKGIMVGDDLRTGDPSIYAIGECASHRGRMYGLVAPCYKMADVLAKRMLGGEAKFSGEEDSCRLKVMGIEVSSIGEGIGSWEQYVYRAKGVYRMLSVKQGHLVGASVVGDWKETAAVEQLVQDEVRIREKDINNFVRKGELGLGGFGGSVLDWPDTAVVCDCTNTSCGALKSAMLKGCKDVDSIMDRAGAGSVCGSCLPLLEDLSGTQGSILDDKLKPKGQKVLMASGLASLVISLVFLVYPGLPAADSVQGAYYKLTKIWQDRLPKQVTGYTLLAISVLSIAISLRKRVKKLSVGNYGMWRAVHGVLGGLTLLFLFFHTGFHGGHNLNLWLFLCFVGLNTAGALTAITIVQNKSSLFGRRLRSWAIRSHILFFWPYPVLLGFHIAKTYQY